MLKNNSGIVFAMCATTFLLVSTTANAATAKENYDRYCTQCHGSGGSGDGINATSEMPVSPRDHTSKKEMGKLTADDVYFAIKDGGKAVGKSALMPKWGGSLKDDEIKALAKYLNKLCSCSYKVK